MAKLPFKRSEVDRLRALTWRQVLRIFDLVWSEDLTFVARKNGATRRVYVSVKEDVFEIVFTDEKWFDPRANKGGGGAIDLTMHLFGVDFLTAVQKLDRALKSVLMSR